MNSISKRTRKVIFFLHCWHCLGTRHDLPSKKPVFQSHAVKLLDVANQGHYYIVNSLQTWEYPIGDPVQILNWFQAWKWGCVLLWPEVFFSPRRFAWIALNIPCSGAHTLYTVWEDANVGYWVNYNCEEKRITHITLTYSSNGWNLNDGRKISVQSDCFKLFSDVTVNSNKLMN